MSSANDTCDTVDNAEFIAPDSGGWHYTVMRDWIAVCPDLSPTAVRLYWIIRSIMLEKGARTRRLSHDQLAYLLPGINGKPTSLTRIKDALKELTGVGLLSNPDGDMVRRWVSDPATGKQTRENYRRWQVHDYPAENEYGEYRSAWAKLDDYTPDWRQATAAVAETTGRRKSDHQSSPAKTHETPGRTGRRKSDPTRRKSDPTRRKSGDGEPVTSTNPEQKEALEGTMRRNHPSTSATEAAAAHEVDTDGWMDHPVIKENDHMPTQEPHSATQTTSATESPDGAGSEREAGSQPVGMAGSVLLAEIEHRHKAHLSGRRGEHVAAVDAALRVLSPAQVRSLLGDGLDQSRNPAGVLVQRIRGLAARAAERQDQLDRHAQHRREAAAAAAQRRSQQETPTASPQARAAANAQIRSMLRAGGQSGRGQGDRRRRVGARPAVTTTDAA